MQSGLFNIFFFLNFLQLLGLRIQFLMHQLQFYLIHYIKHALFGSIKEIKESSNSTRVKVSDIRGIQHKKERKHK